MYTRLRASLYGDDGALNHRLQETLLHTMPVKYFIRGGILGLILVSFFNIYAVASSIDTRAVTQLRSISVKQYAVLSFMIFLSWCCNGGRIWCLARAINHPLKYRQALATSLSKEFGVTSTPGGAGGPVIRIGMLRLAGISMTESAAIFAIDILLDIFYFIILAPMSVYVIIKEPGLFTGFKSFGANLSPLYIVSLAIILAIAVSFRLKKGWERWISGKRTHRMFKKYSRGISSIKYVWNHKKRYLMLDFFLAVIHLTSRYSVLPLLVIFMSSSQNAFPLILIQSILQMISIFLVIPGGGGSVEILSMIILPYYLLESQTGVALVIWRFFTYYLYALTGGLAFFCALMFPACFFGKRKAEAGSQMNSQTGYAAME